MDYKGKKRKSDFSSLPTDIFMLWWGQHLPGLPRLLVSEDVTVTRTFQPGQPCLCQATLFPKWQCQLCATEEPSQEQLKQQRAHLSWPDLRCTEWTRPQCPRVEVKQPREGAAGRKAVCLTALGGGRGKTQSQSWVGTQIMRGPKVGMNRKLSTVRLLDSSSYSNEANITIPVLKLCAFDYQHKTKSTTSTETCTCVSFVNQCLYRGYVLVLFWWMRIHNQKNCKTSILTRKHVFCYTGWRD